MVAFGDDLEMPSIRIHQRIKRLDIKDEPSNDYWQYIDVVTRVETYLYTLKPVVHTSIRLILLHENRPIIPGMVRDSVPRLLYAHTDRGTLV